MPERLAAAINDLSGEVHQLRTQVEGERDDRRAERRRDQRRNLLLMLAAVVVVLLIVAVPILVNRHDLNRSSDQLRGIIATDCPQHKALGESPILPWTTQLGRDLVLFNRASYQRKCLGRPGFGPLKPPDPDLARPIEPSPAPTR
jgi:hypothetical protein